jgi:hypothetical protein
MTEPKRFDTPAERAPAAGKSDGIALLIGDGAFGVSVIDTSRHQVELEAILIGATDAGVNGLYGAALVPERNNVHDPTAVAIYITGRRVGYLQRDLAPGFHETLTRDGFGAAGCIAKIVGAMDRRSQDLGHFGVRLDACLPFTLQEYAGRKDRKVAEVSVRMGRALMAVADTGRAIVRAARAWRWRGKERLDTRGAIVTIATAVRTWRVPILAVIVLGVGGALMISNLRKPRQSLQPPVETSVSHAPAAAPASAIRLSDPPLDLRATDPVKPKPDRAVVVGQSPKPWVAPSNPPAAAAVPLAPPAPIVPVPLPRPRPRAP